MTDFTDCRDLASLQTLVFIIIFLQCSSRMSECYTYLGIAIKAAARMGLHRRLAQNVSPIERETRSRIFWVLRKIDIYVSTMLGLPSSIADVDIDQELPLDIDDGGIHEEGIPLQPCRRFTQMTATIAHIRLMGVLKQVVTHVYPIKGVEQSLRGRSRVYFVEQPIIRETELSLRRWFDNLPESLTAPICDSEHLTRHVLPSLALGCTLISWNSSYLLRVSYHHIRLILYRPFVRCLPDEEQENLSAGKAHAAATAACLNAARHIVHITQQMEKRRLLMGGHWFALYATFFAVFSLIYMVLESPSDDKAPTTFEDAKRGRDLLASFCHRSPIAERCSVSLKVGSIIKSTVKSFWIDHQTDHVRPTSQYVGQSLGWIFYSNPLRTFSNISNFSFRTPLWYLQRYHPGSNNLWQWLRYT